MILGVEKEDSKVEVVLMPMRQNIKNYRGHVTKPVEL